MRAALALVALAAPFASAQQRSAPVWKKLAPGCTPRFAFAAAYSPERKSVLVVAGETRKGEDFDFLHDLWEHELASATWKELQPTGTPPEDRAYHSVAYDTKRGALWLYGGTSRSFAPLADLWRLDAKTLAWTKVEPAGAAPSARANASLHYDAKRDRLVLYGGCKAFFQPDNAYGEVWTFDPELSVWSKRRADGPPRWLTASVLAPELDLLLVQGGFDGNSAARGDAWQYDLAQEKWTELGKGHRITDAHAAVWDPVGLRMLVYGGSTSAKDGVDELWSFDPKKKKWKELTPKGAGPGARAYHVLVLCPEPRSLWTFGGTLNQFNDAPRENEAWTLALEP